VAFPGGQSEHVTDPVPEANEPLEQLVQEDAPVADANCPCEQLTQSYCEGEPGVARYFPKPQFVQVVCPRVWLCCFEFMLGGCVCVCLYVCVR